MSEEFKQVTTMILVADVLAERGDTEWSERIEHTASALIEKIALGVGSLKSKVKSTQNVQKGQSWRDPKLCKKFLLDNKRRIKTAQGHLADAKRRIRRVAPVEKIQAAKAIAFWKVQIHQAELNVKSAMECLKNAKSKNKQKK